VGSAAVETSLGWSVAGRGRHGRSVAGGVLVGALLLPAAVNVATGALPPRWERYAWWAVPAALVLTVVLILMERRRRTEPPEADPPEPFRAGGQLNVAMDRATQNITQYGPVHPQRGGATQDVDGDGPAVA